MQTNAPPLSHSAAPSKTARTFSEDKRQASKKQNRKQAKGKREQAHMRK
jgi:hypothetical protein